MTDRGGATASAMAVALATATAVATAAVTAEAQAPATATASETATATAMDDQAHDAQKEGAKMTKYHVIRSNDSGVHLGIITKRTKRSVKLTDARRAHYWEKGGDCSGLAVHGPSGNCRISPPVTVEVFGVCEIVEATAEAVKQWHSHGDWTES